MSGAYTTTFDWTDARIIKLKAMRAEGLSARQIADKFGGVSRNAVLGKLDRLGVPAPMAKHKHGGARRPIERKFQSFNLKPPILEWPPAPSETETVFIARVFSILDLKPHHCRWPLGEPGCIDFGFCGADKDPRHQSYCMAHASLSVRRHENIT